MREYKSTNGRLFIFTINNRNFNKKFSLWNRIDADGDLIGGLIILGIIIGIIYAIYWVISTYPWQSFIVLIVSAFVIVFLYKPSRKKILGFGRWINYKKKDSLLSTKLTSIKHKIVLLEKDISKHTAPLT